MRQKSIPATFCSVLFATALAGCASRPPVPSPAAVAVPVPDVQHPDGETHDRHQVILTRLEQGRVYFLNALHASAPVGATIEGQGKGPQRRVEALGEESMALERFKALFARGGKAMLKTRA